MSEQPISAQYEKIKTDLLPHLGIMGQAADAILDQDISFYPIFVVHQHSVDIGILLLQKGESDAEWSLNVTTLEELATKNIIEMDRVDQFRQVYKNPKNYLCLFLISELGLNFVFIPRITN